MRTRLMRGKFWLLFMTFGILLAIPAIALADLVEDDVVVNGNDTIGLKSDGNGGFTGSTTVNYKIIQQGTQCEPSTGDDATVTINTPAGVTASPSTLTFNTCDTTSSPASQAVTLTATSFAAHGQQVSVSVADSDATGTGANGYNTNNARFNLQVKKASAISEVSGTGTPNGTGTLTAKLSSAYDATESLAGKPVAFKINGVDVGVAPATPPNGVATLPVNLSSFAAGNYPVEARFPPLPGGDPVYAGSKDIGTLVVKPANTAPTNLALSPSSVAENQPLGTEVGTLSSTDPDSGDTHTYSLVTGTGDADNASFSIVGDKLKTAASFNFEAKNSYTVRVRTTDSGNANFEKQLTINVTNVNEAPTDIALSNNSVEENKPVGTAVGNLSSTDPDTGDTHTYTLVAGAGDGDNGQFTIDGSGTLKTNASFNFEADNSYSIRVKSQDAGGLSTQKQFTINVTDANDAPTDIALSNDSVEENKPVGTAVGNLSSTDPDTGDTHTYTLVAGAGDADNASFTIDNSGTLKTAASFNFEADNSYTVRVRTTDSGNANFEKQLTINVTNVNEAPTDIALSNNSVEENKPVGTAVGNLSSTDPDTGDTHTYTLVAGAGDGDNGQFTIDGSGTLKTNASFNFEADSSYSIRVRTTDSGTPNATFEKSFTIQVNNVNDAPTDIDLSNNSVDENEPSGTAVGNLSSTDEDAGDSHTYTLVAGDGSADNASFTIQGNTLKTAESFNYEAKNSYTVRVRSTDSGNANFEKSFTISVNNVNEAPGAPGAPTLSGSNPNSGAFTLNWSAASDEDAGDTLTYELQHKRNDQSSFSTVNTGISGTSYQFGGSGGNAVEDDGSWTYQVRASDGSLSSSFSGPSGAIRADRIGPSITCPTNATFQLNSGGGSQNVSVSPTDPDLAGGPTGSGSGVNTTAGQLSGTVSTTTVTTPTTPKQVTFTAVDNVGNQTQKTCDFFVVFGGGFLGFQQPINGGLTPVLNTMTQAQATQAYSDDNSRFKLGSTVPVKFELRDANGAPVTNATNIRLFVSQADSKPDPGLDEVFSTSAATTGNLFRLADATTGQWIFNLSTKSGYLNPGATTPTAFTSQGTYKLSAVLDDGSSRSVNIQLVK